MIDEIAEIIPASSKLVDSILCRIPAPPTVKGRLNKNGVPEYSAWPSVIKVVREAIYKRRHPDKAGASAEKVECEVAVLEIVDSCERPIEQQLILDRLATRFRRSEIIDALKVLVANGDINVQGRGGWITYWPKDKPLNATKKEKS